MEIVRLPGVGISRASKVLALYDQQNFGIYDSRATHGISDLVYNGHRLIPIPPGRVIVGDTHINRDGFCSAFQTYTWVLRFLRGRAQEDDILSQHFMRASDVEIALFARSRGSNTQKKINIHPEADIEGDMYWTLGYGRKAKPFWAHVDETEITVMTGKEGKTTVHLRHDTIEEFLNWYRNNGWFPLGNNVTDIKPGGMGEYFRFN